MKHNYFISYCYTHLSVKDPYFRNAVVSHESISTPVDITDIEKRLENIIENERGFEVKVRILFWRRMEEPE